MPSLASVSATSILAFRHPPGYAKLFPYLVGIASALFVGVTLWQIAVYMTWSTLEPFVDAALRDDATLGKDGLSLPYHWLVLWYGAVVVFFWVNLRLPGFLQTAEENSTEADEGP